MALGLLRVHLVYLGPEAFLPFSGRTHSFAAVAPIQAGYLGLLLPEGQLFARRSLQPLFLTL